MVVAAKGSEVVESRWKGHGNERGHWRIICGACSAVLGYVRPQPLSWQAAGVPLSKRVPDGKDRPLPEPEPLIGVDCGGGLEYHPDRDGCYRIRRPDRFGAYGQPVPSRGGRRRHRDAQTDPYWERLSLAISRYANGIASDLERELVEHAVVGEVVPTDRDRLLLRQLMATPGGLLSEGLPINSLPSHADLVLGFTCRPLPFRVYCPREKGDPTHRPCGRLNTVRMPEFVTLTRLNRNGEWLTVVRNNDPILGSA